MDTSAISINNLKVIRGGHTIVSDVTVNIAKASFTYIVGANGSGKTTLIQAILGLIPLDSGKVKLFGEPRTLATTAKYIGYVPQYNTIDRSFPITAREVIELACIQGTHCPTSPKGHLELFEAGHLVNKPIKSLSGGEFQKVLIARAMVNDPEILILDEPVNNLDQKSQRALITKLHELSENEAKTVLLITHDHHLIDQEDDAVLLVSDRTVSAGIGKKMLKTLEHHE